MNEVFSFGSYYPGDSPLHKCDARTKLTLGFVFLIVALMAQGFAGLGVIAVFVAFLYVVSRIPFGKAMRSLAPLMAIALICALLNLFVDQSGETLFKWGIVEISTGSVHSCLFVGCRIILMMMGMSLITMTTTTLDLTAAVEQMLHPFARFGVPAHELGMIMGIALRFMPQFATELANVYHAQISRGAALDGSPVKGLRMLSSVTIPLFASVFRHAETLSAAMDARCYHGKEGRTRLHPLSLAPRDGVACALVAVLLACVIAVNILL